MKRYADFDTPHLLPACSLFFTLPGHLTSGDAGVLYVNRQHLGGGLAMGSPDRQLLLHYGWNGWDARVDKGVQQAALMHAGLHGASGGLGTGDWLCVEIR